MVRTALPTRLNQARLIILTLLLSTSGWNQLTAEDDTGPRFEGTDTLLRPTGYRQWVFVGSSLGLRYDPLAGEKPNRGPERYHNVYINPASYREFARSGKFPDGTMMILELTSAALKNEPGLQGSYQDQFVALEASVKDSKRFKDVWAYFSFDEGNGKLRSKAQPFAGERCWSCHNQKAATDHVFTQFYPVLRAVQAER
jgi:hypothetical protein